MLSSLRRRDAPARQRSSVDDRTLDLFDALTLRPHSREPLDDIHLVVEEPPGSVIGGSWEATAMNADGRARGTLRIVVGDEPATVQELLAEVLADDAED